MKTVEYRVRPVVRYVVTRYSSGVTEDGSNYGGCETVGEYDNELAAERVFSALKAQSDLTLLDTKFVVVRNSFDAATEVYYAYGLEDATATRLRLEQETGADWRIYLRSED